MQNLLAPFPSTRAVHSRIHFCRIYWSTIVILLFLLHFSCHIFCASILETSAVPQVLEDHFLRLQLPFNFALRRVGGATWLGTVLFLLGAVQIGLGFVNDWGQFLGVRIVLGLLQVCLIDRNSAITWLSSECLQGRHIAWASQLPLFHLRKLISYSCVYLISSWYTRFELQRRLSIFYAASVTIVFLPLPTKTDQL